MMSDYNPEQEQGPEAAPMRWTDSSAQVPSANVQATMQQMTTQMQAVIEAAERTAEAIRLDAQEQARRHLAEAQRKADRLSAERVGLISELTDDLVRHAANVRDHSEQMIRALEDTINTVTDKLEQPAMSEPFAAQPQPATSDPFAAQPQPRSVAQHPEWQAPVPAPPNQHSGFVPPPSGYPGEADPGNGAAPEPPPPPPATAPPPPPPPAIAIEPAPAPAAADIWTPKVASEAEPEDDRPGTAPIDAILYASRLAANGTDPTVVASELTNRYGIEDPDPIVDRVFGED